jgi:GNAT superfamily N-acetyltransferase
MVWEVAPLQPERSAEAISTLVRAFMPDPIFSFYFPEAEDREKVFAAFFDDLVRSHIRFGHVYSANMDGRIVGVAVWRPPDAGEPTDEDRERSAVAAKRVSEIDSLAADVLFAGFTLLEQQHPREPHWYLFFTGVEPGLQSRGIGSDLLAPVLEIADRSGEMCYLETPFPRTHAFYRALNFDVTRVGRPFAGAPQIWTMLRPPSLPANFAST